MSEKEESEGSNLECLSSTPNSSPFQQVPANDGYHPPTGVNPYLVILEQPKEYARFRYKSEKKEEIIYGDTSTPDSKTFPTVELKNYNGAATIKCQLYQNKVDLEHVHILYEIDKEPYAKRVSQKDGYIVCFKNLSIIYTKKDVKNQLHNVDLNRVRLKFTAHDTTTNEEICSVFSKPIYNKKNPQTNELKICRFSIAKGSARGGYSMMLFVEKINKGVEVIFFELNAEGERIWETSIPYQFLEVHHQFGIHFLVPPYRDEKAREKMSCAVKVHMELHRVSDGRRSAPLPFVYTPDPSHQPRKRPRYAPVKSTAIPVTEKPVEQQTTIESEFKVVSDISPDLEEGDGFLSEFRSFDLEAILNPPVYTCVFSKPDDVFVPPDPNTRPVEELFDPFNQMPNDAADFEQFMQQHLDPILSQNFWDNAQGPFMNDSNSTLMLESDKPQAGPELQASADDDVIHLKFEQALQIQMLLKDICELKSQKIRDWYTEVTEIFNRLFEIRLNNGDTILHMLQSSDEATLRRLVELISLLGYRNLLNERNDLGLTILHLAVIDDCPDLVTFLVEKGCDPLIGDKKIGRYNAVHYAAMSEGSTLEPLLKAMADSCDHDPLRLEWKLSRQGRNGVDAVMVAVKNNRVKNLEILLSTSAFYSYCNDDEEFGRTALHQAVEQDNLEMVKMLLDNPKLYKGGVDLMINTPPWDTPLHYACRREPRENTLEIVKLLLERGARLTQEVLRLVRRRGGALWDAHKPYLHHYCHLQLSASSSSTSDEDESFHSADEGDSEEDTPLKEIAAKLEDINLVG